LTKKTPASGMQYNYVKKITTMPFAPILQKLKNIPDTYTFFINSTCHSYIAVLYCSLFEHLRQDTPACFGGGTSSTGYILTIISSEK
jgi:hypothetical protein